jgi:RimJ/RimL family protein N-acetyltransferase
MVRLLSKEDLLQLFSGERAGLSRQARLEEAHRVALIAEQLATPYVAVDRTCDRPCFLQWLFTARSNDFVQRYFRGRFPILRDDEALLEYAFTPPLYRGNGIMPAAMSMIAENAAQYGVRYVVTYVSRENPAALQGCAKAGFSPYALRHDRSFFGGLVRKRRFTPIESAPADGSVEAGPPMLVED